MKKVFQIIGSLIYPCVYSYAVYFVVVLCLAAAMSLPWVVALAAFLLGGGLLFGLMLSIPVLLSYPLMWITKKNKVAYRISQVSLVINLIFWIIIMWIDNVGGGWFLYVLLVIASIVYIQAITAIIGALRESHKEEEYDL